MKEYYFIGEQNGVTAAIKEILKEKGVPFTQLDQCKNGLYSVNSEELERIIQGGYKPVCIGCCCSLAEGVEVLKDYRFKVNSSPLEIVAVRYNVSSEWLDLVLMNDEDRYKEYQYSTMVISDLIRIGYSRKQIDKVRAYDRQARGITAVDEWAAENAVKSAQLRNGLLIVNNLPHHFYRAVLDRAFWRQKIQNVVIFTTDEQFLYAGLNDLAFALHDVTQVNYRHWVYAEGKYFDEKNRQSIVRELCRLSKEKMRDGLL